jgi:hypothetical protein
MEEWPTRKLGSWGGAIYAERQAKMKPIVASYANGIIGFDMNKSLRKSILEMSITFAFVLYTIIIESICHFSQLPWSPTCTSVGFLSSFSPRLAHQKHSISWWFYSMNILLVKSVWIKSLRDLLSVLNQSQTLQNPNQTNIKFLLILGTYNLAFKYILCFYIYIYIYSVFFTLLLLSVKKLN